MQTIHTYTFSHHFFLKYHRYCHHSFALPSYFHNLTQLLLHQNSHTSSTITIPRPPFTPINHASCFLSSPPHFLQTTHIHPPLSQLFTHFCISPLILPKFQVLPSPQAARQTSQHYASCACTAQGEVLHLSVCGRQVRHTPSGQKSSSKLFPG